MNRYHLPPTSEALNHRSPARLPNSFGQTLRFASPRHLAEAVDVTPRGERQWWVEPSVEERRHHRGGQRTHRRSHHGTPQTLPQRTNTAYANPYAPPNPAPRPARAPIPAPAPAPPVIPVQAYMPYAPAPQPQPPVGVRPAPAPQNHFANTAPVIPPISVPTPTPAPPEPYATNKHGASFLHDPEPYTRYYHPSGAPAPRVVPAPAAAQPAPPTQDEDSRPSRGRRLSNAVKSLFQKGDCSRAPASAAPPQVVYVAIPAAAAQPADPQPASSNSPAIDRRAEETVERPSSAFNIYTRDMLPRIYGAERDCQRDPHWQGADKEKINVLMPVGLLDCWSILFNARYLKEIHFWHITGDDSWREFPQIEVPKLQTLQVYFNEAWLTNLLQSLLLRRFQHFGAYYSRGCAERFAYDKPAYQSFVSKASQRVKKGRIHISPNHPAYGDRVSSLQPALEAVCQGQRARWDVKITDVRA
ncbi:hypothetical protein K525DRAFT_204286 [Schizophyllum commune Loenen D]|nr:hypothetical protein K525DRAFT_204286 [Schizophyllum commune Loenen D]